jgi:isopenicillin-N epimerase
LRHGTFAAIIEFVLTRREALRAIISPATAAALGISLQPNRIAAAITAANAAAAPDDSPEDVARNEDFWRPIQQAFTVDRTFINLNNGGVSPSPAIVQEATKRHLDFSNTCPPPISLWEILEPQKEAVRQRLANHWGVDAEELALTRNASESLQICQQGFDLKPGDEVLTSTQDYPRMITTFEQRVRRERIVLNLLRLPIPCESDSQVVSLFESNITPRTRLILMSHIVNITGQILPVKKVVAMARKRNVPVVVDGAHALAHFEFKLSDLECDYYGVSLHKWLFAPHGTGLLYVRKDKIKNLWPLMAAKEQQDSDIRKFEEIGTHAAAPILAIAEALTFHQGIRGDRKEARLRFLKDRWAKRLTKFSGRVKLHTSLNPKYSCAIATLEIEGMACDDIAKFLRKKHKILVTPIKHDEFEGIRITPSVYTTLEEIDRFCDAMERVVREGLPEDEDERKKREEADADRERRSRGARKTS